MLIEEVDIDLLLHDPRNARKHPEKNIRAIVNSLESFGAQKPIVIDEENVVVAGNGMLAAAKAMGWTKIPCVRTSLSGAKKKAFAIADNRTAELAQWDDPVLHELMAELKAIEDFDETCTGFDDKEIAAMMNSLGSDGEDDDDEKYVAPPSEPITKPGDIWELGKHRLLCGDCRDPMALEALMGNSVLNLAVTSPPYASQRDYDESSGFKPIRPDEYVAWYEAVAAGIHSRMADNGAYFLNIKPHAEGLDMATYVMELVLAHVRQWGWHWADEYCWQRGGMPREPVNRFKNQFEPVYMFVKGKWKFYPDRVVVMAKGRVPKPMGEGHNTTWASQQGTGKVLAENETDTGAYASYPGNRLPAFQASKSLGHPAVYPWRLPAWFMKTYTDEGDKVFDPFMGSGSTLIAAEHEGRIAYGTELSPAYCDIVVGRWEQLTGQKARRIE